MIGGRKRASYFRSPRAGARAVAADVSNPEYVRCVFLDLCVPLPAFLSLCLGRVEAVRISPLIA